MAGWDSGSVPTTDLVNAMVGREFTYEHTAPEPAHDHTVLQVRGLGRRGVFEDVNFEVDAGEVLGIAGLVGAGRTETVRAIAGADRADTGDVLVDGTSTCERDPAAASWPRAGSSKRSNTWITCFISASRRSGAPGPGWISGSRRRSSA